MNSAIEPKTGAEPSLSIGIVGKDSAGVSLYEYDKRNRLTKVPGDNGTAEYTYNVNGLRKSKTVNGTTTGFIWDGMNMIAETSGSAITANYTYDVTGIAMSNSGGAYQYYLKNAHGDVTGLAAESGVTLADYAYDAFGNQLNSTTETDPFRYCGEYYDEETDSIYLRNRYYSPSIGRFITEDLIKDGFNWYVYCGNNPIAFVDSWGLAITDEDQKAYEIGLLSEANYQLLIEADNLWRSAVDDDYETKTEARKMAVAARRTYNPNYIDDFDYSFGGKNLSGITVAGNTQVGSNTATANTWLLAAAALATIFVVHAGETWQEIADSRPSKNTPIYRAGSDTYYNLTPRKGDVAGLSYSTVMPKSGTYTVTTIEAVNATGILVAIKDGSTHVSVKSIYDHEGWIESKDTANQYPHPCAVALKNISLRFKTGK